MTERTQTLCPFDIFSELQHFKVNIQKLWQTHLFSCYRSKNPRGFGQTSTVWALAVCGVNTHTCTHLLRSNKQPRCIKTWRLLEETNACTPPSLYLPSNIHCIILQKPKHCITLQTTDRATFHSALLSLLTKPVQDLQHAEKEIPLLVVHHCAI